MFLMFPGPKDCKNEEIHYGQRAFSYKLMYIAGSRRTGLSSSIRETGSYLLSLSGLLRLWARFLRCGLRKTVCLVTSLLGVCIGGGGWGRGVRERERASVCVCVCVCEREREREEVCV